MEVDTDESNEDYESLIANDKDILKLPKEKQKKQKLQNGNELSVNPGWADAIAKVLGKKESSFKKKIILAKAKKDKDIKLKPKIQDIEIVNEEGKIVKENTEHLKQNEKIDNSQLSEKQLLLERRQKKLLRDNMGRIKPNIKDQEKERTLTRIATRGMVVLFNTVKNHQKVLGEKLNAAGNSEVRRDKILQSFTKGEFLDMLKAKKDQPQQLEKSPTEKSNVKQKKTWDVLRDNYMMEATLKDWDKDSDEDI